MVNFLSEKNIYIRHFMHFTDFFLSFYLTHVYWQFIWTDNIFKFKQKYSATCLQQPLIA